MGDTYNIATTLWAVLYEVDDPEHIEGADDGVRLHGSHPATCARPYILAPKYLDHEVGIGDLSHGRCFEIRSRSTFSEVMYLLRG